MRVVSNTSPLSYLLLIGEAGVLPRLFGEVWIPGAVLAELGATDAPEILRRWAQAPPAWLHIQEPLRPQTGFPLHIGEDRAIALALELKADRLIMDDRAGREAAQALGLPLVGTIGILDLAAERGLVDLPRVLKRLEETNFRIARRLMEEVMQRDAKRRSAGKNA